MDIQDAIKLLEIQHEIKDHTKIGVTTDAEFEQLITSTAKYYYLLKFKPFEYIHNKWSKQVGKKVREETVHPMNFVRDDYKVTDSVRNYQFEMSRTTNELLMQVDNDSKVDMYYTIIKEKLNVSDFSYDVKFNDELEDGIIIVDSDITIGLNSLNTDYAI